MGEENKSEGRFYVTGPNGEITTMGEMEGLPELIGKMPEEPTRIRFGDLEWEIKVPIPKVLRCKSRKRIIKLLMSTGMPRNTATKLAEAMYTYGVKYQDGWLTFIYRRLRRTMQPGRKGPAHEAKQGAGRRRSQKGAARQTGEGGECVAG